jgi:hypothetical protein
VIGGKQATFDLKATCAEGEEQEQEKGGGEPGPVMEGEQQGKPGRERGTNEPDRRREDRKLRRPNPRKKDDNERHERSAHRLVLEATLMPSR